MQYIMDEHGNPISEPDIQAWAEYINNNENRVLAQDTVGNQFISTVFLGINYGWNDEAPVIFETMIFTDGDMSGEEQRRYTTREESLLTHAAIVAELKREQGTGCTSDVRRQNQRTGDED